MHRLRGDGHLVGVGGMKALAKRAYEASQHITLRAMRAVRPGAYRIIDGVLIEDGGQVIHEIQRPVSGVRKKVSK